MVRGNLRLQDVEGSKTPAKDGSYKSCLITMLIVFLICIIIILILWRTEPSPGDTSTEDPSRSSESKLYGYVAAPTTSRTTVTKTSTSTTPGKLDDISSPLTSKDETVPTSPDSGGIQNISTDSSSDVTPEVTTDLAVSQSTISILTTLDATYSEEDLNYTETTADTGAVDFNSTDKETAETQTHLTTMITVGDHSTDNATETASVTPGSVSDISDISTDNETEQTASVTPRSDYSTDDVTTVKTTSFTTKSVSDAQSGVTVPIKTKVNGTCQTSECMVLASRMLSLMNHSVDPCDNFYEFACGGLRDNPTLLQEDLNEDVWIRIASSLENVNSSSNLAYQEFRSFYDQCEEYEHTVNQSYRFELAQKMIGEVNIMYNTTEWLEADKSFNLTNLLIKLFNLDSAPLFDISVDVNSRYPSTFQLKLTVPSSHSKLQLEPLSEVRCRSRITSGGASDIDMKLIYETQYLPCIRNYTEYFATLEKAVLDLELFGNTDMTDVKEHLKEIKSFVEFDVFSLLQEIDPWRLRVNIQEKSFTTKTVEQLQTQYPEVEWDTLLRAVSKTSVDKDTEVQLYFEEYFDKLFSHLKVKISDSTNRSAIHNGLLAMFAHDIYVDLVEPRPCNREEYCLKIAAGLMKHTSSSLYLSSFTSQELSDKEHELKTLFQQLTNVLNKEINDSKWLEEEIRENMLNKLNSMTVEAHGSRSILLDDNILNNSSRTTLRLNNHFENSRQLLVENREKLFNHLGYNLSATKDILFFSLPSDVHPVSVYGLNSVILPFGMIGSWKPTNKIPSFVWKAHVGNEIARQIVHHFDTTGVKYNASGVDVDFLKGKSKDSYEENYIKCENAFDNNKLTWTNQKNQKYIYQVIAARTMNEHVTDNSALWLTYLLYNNSADLEQKLPWLDVDQDELYLLLAAQKFCAKAELLDYTTLMFETGHFAPHLRVKNMIENSVLYDDVYKCIKKNSKCAPFPRQDVNVI